MSEYQFTLKEPHTRSSPSALIAAEMLSPAAILTARKFSSIKAWTGSGLASRSLDNKSSPGFAGSGTSSVMRPKVASSLIPKDHT